MSPNPCYYVLDGKRGASSHRVIYYKEEESEFFVVQHKSMSGIISLGRFRKFSDARDVACRKMAELQKQYGNQRAGIKLKPRVDLVCN